MLFYDDDVVDEFCTFLAEYGCDFEFQKARKLAAVDVPDEAKYHVLLEKITALSQRGSLDYEESALRF